jgi:hypothetical protein
LAVGQTTAALGQPHLECPGGAGFEVVTGAPELEGDVHAIELDTLGGPDCE